MAAEEDHVELFTTTQTKLGAATSDFGYNLFRALANREPAANIFLAPISVSAALTQLSLGNRLPPICLPNSKSNCALAELPLFLIPPTNSQVVLSLLRGNCIEF